MKCAITPAQVREQILSAVSANGGHLASSLGAVELAFALTEVFDPAVDRVVWDVGHQAYAWKILTGRAEKFHALRLHGGVAPFLLPSESDADAFISGHAGVAIAAAAGLAAGEARLAHGKVPQVVAVVGDAALMNGESLEALHNLVRLGHKIIVVLNDNGHDCTDSGCAFTADFFKVFGLPYVGPVDGHDVEALVKALASARECETSIVVHAVTQKGKGFPPAEADPAAWHCVGPFELAGAAEVKSKGECDSILHTKPSPSAASTWSDWFGEAMVAAARRDDRVCAVVAAMKEGTGLSVFAEEFSGRFFDVGICEEMAVTFAAGLAKAGMRPVVAIYSTFLQRAIDQIQHDVCLQHLPVVFAIDRAGCVGADGATHHGLYDISLLRSLTGIRIFAPICAEDMAAVLDDALFADGPSAIRYPKGEAVRRNGLPTGNCQRENGVRILAVGDQVQKAIKVKRLLANSDIAADVVPVDRVKPIAFGESTAKLTVAMENGVVSGGFGESVGADLKFGWPDAAIGHGTVDELEREFGFDAESVALKIAAHLRKMEERYDG